MKNNFKKVEKEKKIFEKKNEMTSWCLSHVYGLKLIKLHLLFAILLLILLCERWRS